MSLSFAFSLFLQWFLMEGLLDQQQQPQLGLTRNAKFGELTADFLNWMLARAQRSVSTSIPRRC